MTDDQIKDLLDSTAPGRPDLTPGERVGAVTARARATRRRGRVLAAAAAIAVVGVGVGVPVALSGDDADRGPVAADPSEPPAKAAPCPAEPIDAEKVGSTPDLPDGAVSARLCPATFQGSVGDLDRLPTEPLTDDVDTFLDALRALPPGELDAECALVQMAPEPWALVVSYPDGDVTFGSTMRSCSVVSVAGVDRTVEAVLETYTAAVPTPGGAPPCPAPTSGGLRSLEAQADTYDGSFTDFVPVAASLCYGVDPMGGPEYAETEAALGQDAMSQLFSEAGRAMSGSPIEGGMCTDAGPTRLFVLVDADGRRVTFVDSDCTGEFTSRWGFWRPSERAEDRIAQELGGRTDG